MTYDIDGTILTNPTITINGMEVRYNEQKTFVDVLLDDGTNDAPVMLEALVSDIPIPATTKENAILAWVNKKLKDYKV